MTLWNVAAVVGVALAGAVVFLSVVVSEIMNGERELERDARERASANAVRGPQSRSGSAGERVEEIEPVDVLETVS